MKKIRKRICDRLCACPDVSAYVDVARAAMHVHQMVWFYGENNSFPEGLEQLPELDAILSDALSRIPPVEEGE